VRFVREGGAEIGESGDTIPRAFAQLAEELGEDAARARLENLRFHPVFTAHPTEARRRAVASSIRRLAALLEERTVSGADPAAGRRIHRRLLEEIDTLWRTAPLRSTQPAPEDEVRSLMTIFDETLYTTLPRMYRYVDDALQPDDAGRRPPLVRPFVRLGTWVGGDRDGDADRAQHHARLRRDAAVARADRALAQPLPRRRGGRRGREAQRPERAPQAGHGPDHAPHRRHP
jgi:phosphoenolpyruvate carboxylase